MSLQTLNVVAEENIDGIVHNGGRHGGTDRFGLVAPGCFGFRATFWTLERVTHTSVSMITSFESLPVHITARLTGAVDRSSAKLLRDNTRIFNTYLRAGGQVDVDTFVKHMEDDPALCIPKPSGRTSRRRIELPVEDVTALMHCWATRAHYRRTELELGAHDGAHTKQYALARALADAVSLTTDTLEELPPQIRAHQTSLLAFRDRRVPITLRVVNGSGVDVDRGAWNRVVGEALVSIGIATPVRGYFRDGVHFLVSYSKDPPLRELVL